MKSFSIQILLFLVLIPSKQVTDLANPVTSVIYNLINKKKTSAIISKVIPKYGYTQEEVSVTRFGAKGNGITDDTQAIQKAIDYAKANKKSIVLFPSGRYRLSKGSITVKQGILLKGIDIVPAKSGFGSDLCQFEVTIGAGNTKTPAFIMESFSGMAGFAFLYPNQSKQAPNPTPYGWTITTNGKASQDGITLRNLMLTNPYQGIKLDNGGQHTLENIYGQPIKTGIMIDRQYDVLRINNVHFWTFYSQPGQALYNWIEANGEAIVLHRTDGLQGTNWFAYGYRRGLHLADVGTGAPWLTANNILFDVCKEPVVIDAVAFLTLNNVTLTGANVSSSQNGILINKTVNDINSLIQISGLTGVNLTNSLVNKGVCTITASMKSKAFDGKNNGVRWFDVINENDDALLNITTPLRPGDDYRRIAGKMQINGVFTYQSLTDVTPNNFGAIHQWEGAQGRVKSIPGGSRFNVIGAVSVAGYLLPPTIRNVPGVYLLEMTIKSYTNTGALGPAAFYPRLRDYPNGIDYHLSPHTTDPYFLTATVVKIPFVINSGNIYLDFVFGNATKTTNAYIDVTNVKLYRATGTQSGYKELMPKHQKFNQF